MNDEIRETIEYKINYLTKSLDIGIPTKNRRYFNDIKNYITNLQQENEAKEKVIIKQDYVINELEKYIKENSIYYNTSDGCQWIDQFKVLDKLKELKEKK